MIKNSTKKTGKEIIRNTDGLPLANSIMQNSLFLTEMEAIRRYEAERIFCRHDMQHLLSVARITLIMCRENGIEASRDLILYV